MLEELRKVCNEATNPKFQTGLKELQDILQQLKKHSYHIVDDNIVRIAYAIYKNALDLCTLSGQLWHLVDDANKSK
jgi:hypothetical protein